MNAISDDSGRHVVGGLLAGLERAGLIARIQAPMPTGNIASLVTSSTPPLYIPGPLFPEADDGSA